MTKKFDNDKPYQLNMNEKYIIFMTATNINFNAKNILVQLAWTGPLALACKLALAGTPAQPH